MQHSDDMQEYRRSCGTEFWQKVFRAEMDYLQRHLAGSRKVLSVGCGPAIIESGLTEHGFHVTGVDISEEALACVPEHVRTIAVRAEDMDVPEGSFDAVIYVASLQFIEDYRKAIEKTAHVLRPGGKIIVMLLNPESVFFKGKLSDPHSYVQEIRHTNLKEIEDVIAGHFSVHTEYFLSVKDDATCESGNVADAILFVIEGWKRSVEKDDEV